MKTKKLSFLMEKGHKLLPRTAYGELIRFTSIIDKPGKNELVYTPKYKDKVTAACALGKAIFATIPVSTALQLLKGEDGTLEDHVSLDEDGLELDTYLSKYDISYFSNASIICPAFNTRKRYGKVYRTKCKYLFDESTRETVMHLNDLHKWPTVKIIKFLKSYNL